MTFFRLPLGQLWQWNMEDDPFRAVQGFVTATLPVGGFFLRNEVGGAPMCNPVCHASAEHPLELDEL